jgi:hypothetical protein
MAWLTLDQPELAVSDHRRRAPSLDEPLDAGALASTADVDAGRLRWLMTSRTSSGCGSSRTPLAVDGLRKEGGQDRTDHVAST